MDDWTSDKRCGVRSPHLSLIISASAKKPNNVLPTSRYWTAEPLVWVKSEFLLPFCSLQTMSCRCRPLTPDTNEAFPFTKLPFAGYFHFFQPSSLSLRDGCDVAKNPSRSAAVCETRSPERLAPMALLTTASVPFIPHSAAPASRLDHV